MNEIANIIAQLEARKAAVEQALEALRDFDQTGSITPTKATSKAPARKGGMTPEGRRRIALAMKRRWAAKHTVLRRKKQQQRKPD